MRSAFFNAVSDGYFATLGTRLLAGRDFDVHDVAGAPPVAVINEAMARKFFRGANPVGRRIGTSQRSRRRAAGHGGRHGARREVRLAARGHAGGGVSADGAGARVPARRRSTSSSAGCPRRRRSSRAVTRVLAQLNPTFSITYTTLSAQVDASLARERLLATLSAFFGALALLLAVIGLYGTMSYTLAQRRKEIGVRIALGAARSRVMRLVLGEVGRLVAAGVVIGGAIAYLATRWVTPFLFGVSPLDPMTWALATATLAGRRARGRRASRVARGDGGSDARRSGPTDLVVAD